jgi:hypothetical protein
VKSSPSTNHFDAATAISSFLFIKFSGFSDFFVGLLSSQSITFSFSGLLCLVCLYAFATSSPFGFHP